MGAEPSLPEIIREAFESRLLDLHVALPGRVESYDESTQTADVLPMVRRALLGSDGRTQHEDLPVLPNVPIAFPQSDAFSASWPIPVGSHVLLVVCSSAVGQWRESGDVSDPVDLRRHDLSYSFAIPGIAPVSKTIPTDSSAAVLEVSTPATHVKVGAGATDWVAMNQKVLTELQSLETTFNLHTHIYNPGPSPPANTGPPSATYSAPADVAATKLQSE